MPRRAQQAKAHPPEPLWCAAGSTLHPFVDSLYLSTHELSHFHFSHIFVDHPVRSSPHTRPHSHLSVSSLPLPGPLSQDQLSLQTITNLGPKSMPRSPCAWHDEICSALLGEMLRRAGPPDVRWAAPHPRRSFKSKAYGDVGRAPCRGRIQGAESLT